MTLHILHVTPYYAPAWTFGGVISAVSGLATAQAARGNRVTVLTTDALTRSKRIPIPHERLDGVTVVRCPNLLYALQSRLNLSTPRGFGAQLRALCAEGVDIMHSHELRTVQNVIVARQGSRNLLPLVVSPHGTLSYETGRSLIKRLWDRLLGRSILRRIDQVAALTAAEMDEARELWQLFGSAFPGGSLLPNGIDSQFVDQITAADSNTFRARFKLGDGPIVLFLGRLHERKGLQFLIPAFAEAARNDPSARLLIVGPDEGMLTIAQALTAQHGIADRTVFTGLLHGADRFAAYKSATMFVLPAVGEGLSMASLEAMAAGLPVILTPGCHLPEVGPRGAGVIVEREIAPITEALRALLSDRNQAQVMGRRGQTWVSEAFTWPTIAAQSESIYQNVIEHRRNTKFQ